MHRKYSRRLAKCFVVLLFPPTSHIRSLLESYDRYALQSWLFQFLNLILFPFPMCLPIQLPATLAAPIMPDRVSHSWPLASAQPAPLPSLLPVLRRVSAQQHFNTTPVTQSSCKHWCFLLWVLSNIPAAHRFRLRLMQWILWSPFSHPAYSLTSFSFS